MDTLNHFDEHGKAIMVEVSEKPNTKRIALASGRIKMSADTFLRIEQGTNKKGDVLGVARIAGIMATKRTPDIIPLCHPVLLEKVSIDFKMYPNINEIEVLCTAQLSGKTGVEMEALTGVSATLLTIYDMCKAMDRGMEIFAIHLLSKTGGKSGTYTRATNTEETSDDR